jgi:hypothetical protein
MAVEWKADREGFGPPRGIRISASSLESLLATTGTFSFRYLDWSEHHYILLAEKAYFVHST